MESEAGRPVIAILSPLLESNEALRRWLRMESDAPPLSMTLLASRLLARNLEIRRGLEGPQLVLTWTSPEVTAAIEKIVIVRKKYDFPTTPLNGPGQKIVYEGPPADGSLTEIFDDIEACRCYYYTVFTVLFGGEALYDPSTQVSEFAVRTGFFAKKLMELLPDAYLIADKKLDELERGRVVLERVFDDVSKEFFNLYEDGVKDKGQLQRLLQILAIELDLVKGLIDCLPTMFDVDETCCRFLEAMAAGLGFGLNNDLSCSRRRNEVKNAVAIYKVKGTRKAIEARARATCGFDARVQNWCGNVLISNRIDRTTVKFPNPGFSGRFMQPGDDTDYTPGGGTIGFFRFTVFLLLGCDDCLSEQCLRKLNRVLPPEYPVCRVGRLAAIDCAFRDEYDRDRLREVVCEVLEDRTVAEDNRTSCWLITNRLPGTDGCRRHSTNSACAVTANPFRVCVERYFDEEESSETFVDSLPDCWLIANRPERITNTVRWRTPGSPRCMPIDGFSDQVQVGEFVENANCAGVGLAFVSNRPEGLTVPPSLTNTLQSLVEPCSVGEDFAFDETECLRRVNRGRVNCERVNEG